ncbi:MAG: nucleotide exchange factor GrpE [Rhizobiales bacterium 65-79]|nr:nucleotide exchange factor GrpE [Hyphomicrobiales bacterium]OJU01847.1 MAG: nucleotide exchange factor GrpE [Rhizobiales bacterium 65-79]
MTRRPRAAAENDDSARTAMPETGEASAEAPDGDAVARLEAENASLKDRLLRALAEVENVRRRSERDLGDMRQYAVAKFAGDMLSVADNLERAVASVPKEVRESSAAVRTMIEGVELTGKEMLNVLEKHGIRKLDPVGERFDPNFHEALFEVPDPTVPSGTVSQVVEPGYAIGTRPLRPAKVGIARGGGGSRAEPTQDGRKR